MNYKSVSKALVLATTQLTLLLFYHAVAYEASIS